MPVVMTTPPSRNQRILDGFLHHVNESRSALRWVVLEMNHETGHMYLSIYRKTHGEQTESELKKRYELTTANFIGTERGTIKEGGRNNVLYWAIILKGETLLFKDKEATHKSTSTFEKWNDTIKQLWKHQSWEVSPVEGDAIHKHPKLILHLNSASLSLALLSPPRHFLRWPLANLLDCRCSDHLFAFDIGGKDRPGTYKVKVTRSKHASKIKTVCEELQRGVQDERRRLPPVPTHVPSVEVISPDDVTSSLEDLNAGHRRASEHRNSSTSTSSLQSNQWDKDTASIASMDSMISTPSPTVHLKDGINPFDFEDASRVCVEVDVPLGSGVVDFPRRASHGSPEMQQKSGTKSIPSPRLSRPGIRPIHTFQDPLPYHVAYVNTKTKTVLIKSSDPGGPSDGPASPKYAEPSPRPRSPHPHPPPPPESKYPSVSLPSPVRARSPTIGVPMISSDVQSSMSLDRREISLLRHLSSPSNLGQVEDDHSGLESTSRLSARDTWPGQLERQTSNPGPDRTYMNTQEGTDRVDLSTEPCGQTTYMNLPEEHSHYQNPPLDPTKSSLCIVDKVGPKLPPRSQPPQLPPRNKKYKLYELVDLAKSGKLVVGNLIQSFDAFKRFCLFFDVKKDSFPPKDWRALAERVGLTVQDIQVIDDVCQRSSSATEIVLAYWECHTPDDMPYTLDQLVRELDRMDRQDLVEIVVQGDKSL